MRTISKTIGRGGQIVLFVEVLEIRRRIVADDDHKLRIKIKVDSVRFQSYARIEKWDGDKWRRLHEIHYSTMKSYHKVRSEGEHESVFQADREELLRVAVEVLRP